MLCILSQASNCIAAINSREHITTTHHGDMPTPDAKFWALLCMSCLCAVIRAHRIRQAHVFLPKVREAYLVACKWKLFLKSLLVVQNFKIAFNSVGAIVSTLSNMGSLEKVCFRLNVFVQLSS